MNTTPAIDPAEWEALDAGAAIRLALERFHPRIAIASSFSMEDNLLVHLAAGHRPDVRVFALDTGRLPEETLACADAMARRYHLQIEWYHPRHEAVEGLVRAKGMYSFRESVENRRECCHIRKVEPLARALAGLDAWITGLRRQHGPTRAGLAIAERDEAHGGILKLNPLAAWSTAEVKAFVQQHGIPINRLYAQGYTSIGCAPCTRAIQPGEDERAGRWWWENPDHKECGLHR